MKEIIKDRAEETRKIYHEQHKRVAADQRAMERFLGMFTLEYFGLGNDYFKGKRVFDAGCGNMGKMLIKMHQFGAAEIHGLDLGEDFIPEVHAILKEYDVPVSKVKLRGGSILELPYEDNSFDFVSCHGVLIHLNTLEEVSIAFKELARVTKPGGHLYTVYGEESGLFNDCLVPALRDYYFKNKAFQELVDNLKPENFGETIDFIEQGMANHTGETADLSKMKDLLDLDLCVTIQNLIQAPVRHSIGEAAVKELYGRHHFSGLRRLRRYVKRKNIRKYFAPLHFHMEHPMSQILYGNGNLDYIGQKGK